MSSSKKIVANKVIQPITMYNRKDLSKMSKDELINMLIKNKLRAPIRQDQLIRLRAPKRQDQSSSLNDLHN